jgi:hypothetical protein
MTGVSEPRHDAARRIWNGVAKNNRTARHFKRVVRILKRLRNEMAEI